MDISDFLGAVKKRVWFILALMLVAVAASGWISFFVLTPVYEGTTTVLIQPNVDKLVNPNDIAANEKLVPTYSLIIKSKKTAAAVIERLNLDISADALLKKIEVTGLRNSLVTKITVTDPDPVKAASIANAFAQSFKDNLPDLMYVPRMSILDAADIKGPPKPVSPKPLFNMAAALVLACNLGVGFSVLLEALDKTVKSEQLLFEALTLPVMSVLAKFPKKHAKLFCFHLPSSFNSEAVRKLRANINYLLAHREIQTLLVTSALPAEGKTIAAANLAIAIAQEGKKVLLIEADMRSPSLHELFDISSGYGLSSVLNNKSELNPVPSIQSNLDLLPCGAIPPNPAELLGSKEMSALVNSCKQQYEFIVLDTVAVIPFADAQIVAGHCDAVILVTKLGATPLASTVEAKNLLDRLGANVIGTVANYKRIKSKTHLVQVQKDTNKGCAQNLAAITS